MLEYRGEVRRRGGRKAETLSGGWVLETKQARMQELVINHSSLSEHGAGKLTLRSIERISYHGMAQVLEMHSNLMRSSCLEATLE